MSICLILPMLDICLFSDKLVNNCQHVKAYINIMYYMRLHHVYMCSTATSSIYVYVLWTHVGHDKMHKKIYVRRLLFTDSKCIATSCQVM